jgi:hypothetical protein
MKEITKEDILNWKATPEHNALWDAIYRYCETVGFPDVNAMTHERLDAVVNFENKLQKYVESKK